MRASSNDPSDGQTHSSWRENLPLQKYYASLESRIGYWLVLGGTRHFGYYANENDWPFPISSALRRMEDRLYDALSLAADAEVLDAGCGVGHVAIHLADRGLNIYGIDIVDRHLTYARKNVHAKGLDSRVQLAKADYHSLLLFQDYRFDGVYTMETLVHATDPLSALQEFHRVLKPGGKLALFEYDHPDMASLPKNVRESMETVNKYSAMSAHQKFDQGVLEKLLEEAGFENVRVDDISKNIIPMLAVFWWLAIIPYYIVTFLGLQSRFVNTLAGAEGYRAMKRGWSRYIVVTANKPGNEAAISAHDRKKTR
jgi:sterol 24-C-methyltransferase